MTYLDRVLDSAHMTVIAMLSVAPVIEDSMSGEVAKPVRTIRRVVFASG